MRRPEPLIADGRPNSACDRSTTASATRMSRAPKNRVRLHETCLAVPESPTLSVKTALSRSKSSQTSCAPAKLQSFAKVEPVK
jgi:hypothetical protein